jgi:hypothetical protein
MTLLRALTAALLFSSIPACAASSPEIDAVESEASELRSVTFFERAPLSGRRLETFRGALAEHDMGHVWARNQGTVSGVQWEGRAKPTAAAVARGGLSFLGRRGARDVKVATDLESALDTIGLQESSPDPATAKARAELSAALRDIARTRGVTVFTASLHDAPDMYWENALIVVDEEHHQLVVATGGFGT